MENKEPILFSGSIQDLLDVLVANNNDFEYNREENYITFYSGNHKEKINNMIGFHYYGYATKYIVYLYNIGYTMEELVHAVTTETKMYMLKHFQDVIMNLSHDIDLEIEYLHNNA